MTYKATVKIEVSGLTDRSFATEVSLALVDVGQTIVSLPGFPGIASVTGQTEEEK